MPLSVQHNPLFFSFTQQRIVAIIFLAAFFIVQHDLCMAAKINLPKDAQGWTIFTPSSDSRIVYISPNGNDATCKAYLKNDAAIGSNPFVPTRTVATCKTLAKALTLTRNNYPDWILFKRGGVYRQSIAQNSIHSGRSATEPFLIAGYGASGALPSLRPVAGSYFWRATYRSLQFLIFANLEWYADTVNPASRQYIDSMTDKSTTIFIYSANTAKQGIMWEGNLFRGTKFNLQQASPHLLHDCIFRRNVMIDTNNSAGYLQGSISSWLIEENIFDHGGWYDMNYPAVSSGDRWRNHNVYLSPGNNTVFKNNISSRACSMGIKTQTEHDNNATDEENSVHQFTVENNLFVDNNIGIALASNNGHIQYRMKDVIIKNNVITHGGTTNASTQNISWGLIFDGLDGATITHNMIIHQYDWPNSVLITSEASTGRGSIAWGKEPYKSRDVTITDNIFQGSNQAKRVIIFAGGIQWDNFTWKDNIFDMRDDSHMQGLFTYDEKDGAGYGLTENNTIWHGNTYYNSARLFTFLWPNYDSTILTQEQWKAQYDTTAKFAAPSYPDDTRSIETYMSHLGEPATLNTFYAKIRGQNRYNWDPNYTAPVINDWLRAGYFTSQHGDALIPPGLRVQ